MRNVTVWGGTFTPVVVIQHRLILLRMCSVAKSMLFKWLANAAGVLVVCCVYMSVASTPCQKQKPVDCKSIYILY